MLRVPRLKYGLVLKAEAQAVLNAKKKVIELLQQEPERQVQVRVGYTLDPTLVCRPILGLNRPVADLFRASPRVIVSMRSFFTSAQTQLIPSSTPVRTV